MNKIDTLIEEKEADVKSIKEYIFDKFKAKEFSDLTNEQADIIIANVRKKKVTKNNGK